MFWCSSGWSCAALNANKLQVKNVSSCGSLLKLKITNWPALITITLWNLFLLEWLKSNWHSHTFSEKKRLFFSSTSCLIAGMALFMFLMGNLLHEVVHKNHSNIKVNSGIPQLFFVTKHRCIIRALHSPVLLWYKDGNFKWNGASRLMATRGAQRTWPQLSVGRDIGSSVLVLVRGLSWMSLQESFSLWDKELILMEREQKACSLILTNVLKKSKKTGKHIKNNIFRLGMGQ